MKRIVLTGGPGAGKTVISAQIAAARPDRFINIPEAATQVYFALQTRWDRLDLAGRRSVQQEIYRLQVDQESRMAREHPNHTLLLDRGTIDGAAYWPEGAEQYWPAIQTSQSTELTRYDAVIWLQSCAALGIYDGATSNACRFEDAAGALASGELLLTLWKDHPQLHIVPAQARIEDKLNEVQRLLNLINA